MIQLVNERGDEVAPVTKRIIKRLPSRQVRVAGDATSSSSGVQGGSATATTTNQNNDFGALDVNEYQGEYGGEGEKREGVYYDEERVLVHQEEAYDPAAYVITAAASYEDEDERRLAGMSGSCRPEDVVTCVDGFAISVGGSNVTCQQACDGGCCLGNGFLDGSPINSCTGFNGKVCKSGDIPSCSDNRASGDSLGRACYRASITEVVNGCNGREACTYAGGYNGDLGRVVNGCHGGDGSCSNAARDGGYIKEIVDSCIGKRACNGAAIGGFIGYINHGCRGEDSCPVAAYNRRIDGISYACNNFKSCYKLADGRYGYASVNSAVVSCCNEESECQGSTIDQYGILPAQCPTPPPTTIEVRMLFILYALRPFINL